MLEQTTASGNVTQDDDTLIDPNDDVCRRIDIRLGCPDSELIACNKVTRASTFRKIAQIFGCKNIGNQFDDMKLSLVGNGVLASNSRYLAFVCLPNRKCILDRQDLLERERDGGFSLPLGSDMKAYPKTTFLVLSNAVTTEAAHNLPASKGTTITKILHEASRYGQIMGFKRDTKTKIHAKVESEDINKLVLVWFHLRHKISPTDKKVINQKIINVLKEYSLKHSEVTENANSHNGTEKNAKEEDSTEVSFMEFLEEALFQCFGVNGSSFEDYLKTLSGNFKGLQDFDKKVIQLIDCIRDQQLHPQNYPGHLGDRAEITSRSP